jgi:glycosyltransferase involved in cell wall biosynthesis
MTVCQGIAREYVKTYNISLPQIVYNAPPFQHLKPTTTQNSIIRLVHHGASLKGRRLESLIEMMAYLDDRYTLDFFLMPDGNGYLQQLKSLAKGDSRIKFNDPVAMQDLPKVCNQYDVGVYTLPPSNFNNLNALPNKIFEFIQARLALAIGPSPEMSQIVRDYNCGVVAKDYSAKALAEALLTLSQDNIANYKKNSALAAKVLCAENSSETILNLIQ